MNVMNAVSDLDLYSMFTLAGVTYVVLGINGKLTNANGTFLMLRARTIMTGQISEFALRTSQLVTYHGQAMF